MRLPLRQCAVCKVEFNPTYGSQLYCRDICAKWAPYFKIVPEEPFKEDIFLTECSSCGETIIREQFADRKFTCFLCKTIRRRNAAKRNGPLKRAKIEAIGHKLPVINKTEGS